FTTFAVIVYGNQRIFPVFYKKSENLISWMKNNVSPNEKVLLAKCTGGDPNIALRAGLSWKNVDWILLYPNYLIFSLRHIYQYDKRGIENYIYNERPSYIITSYPRFLYNINKIIRKNEKLRKSVVCEWNITIKPGYFILEIEYDNEKKQRVIQR
ncbi:MAG: hypothetical protein D6734_04880, partial [Candidatus Schekmanbacteria bacterium]